MPVALAEALSAELLTCDAGLKAAIRKHAAKIRLVGEIATPPSPRAA